MAAARALLAELDALDGAGRVTAIGRRMARLGTHPRLARMLAAAETEGEKAMAADLAALLEERDPIRGREAPADIGLRLDLLHGGDHPNADRPAIQRIRRAAALHRRRLGVHGSPSTPRAIPARCWRPASPTGSPPCAASWPAPSGWPPARGRGWP